MTAEADSLLTDILTPDNLQEKEGLFWDLVLFTDILVPIVLM